MNRRCYRALGSQQRADYSKYKRPALGEQSADARDLKALRRHPDFHRNDTQGKRLFVVLRYKRYPFLSP